MPQAAPHLKIHVPNISAMGSGEDDEVKTEQGSNGDEGGNATTGEEVTEQAVTKLVDYQISPKDLGAAKAFRIFVEALYNEEPDTIKDRDSLKTALKAYQFARKYEAYVLQNRLVERFREHYHVHKVKVDELLWMIKMFGDDANATPLTRYLLEQIAHDISTRGFNAFSADNGYLKFYLGEGNRSTRYSLFAILARHANDRRHPDPAEGRNEWRVIESGVTAGEWVPEPFSIH